jgi:hypothetical protein
MDVPKEGGKGCKRGFAIVKSTGRREVEG